MSYTITMRPEPQKTLAAASIVAGYAAVGTPLSSPSCLLMFYNQTDAAVQFSFDGTNDHVALAPGTIFPINITGNAPNSVGFIKQATQFYVKRIGTPTTGAVFITSFYVKST